MEQWAMLRSYEEVCATLRSKETYGQSWPRERSVEVMLEREECRGRCWIRKKFFLGDVKRWNNGRCLSGITKQCQEISEMTGDDDQIWICTILPVADVTTTMTMMQKLMEYLNQQTHQTNQATIQKINVLRDTILDGSSIVFDQETVLNERSFGF